MKYNMIICNGSNNILNGRTISTNKNEKIQLYCEV